MGRSPCCDEHGLKKGPWTPEEDQKLIQHIHEHGHGSWRALPKLAGLNRCGKSCRLRWTNYLRPDIKRGKFSQEEEHTILNLHSLLGNKWSAIAGHLPGRTDNEIKNFWNTHLKKKLIQMGFDPVTHRPRTDLFSNLTHLIALAKLREMMDQHIWEAEAVELARVQFLQQLLQPTTAMSNSSNSLNNITTMEAMSILNSIAPSYKETMAFSSQPLTDQEIFSQLPGLQVDLKPPMNNEINQVSENIVFFNGENTANSQIVTTTTTLTEHSIGNNGDACSSSSNGRDDPYFWPEIIEDPLFHEIV